MDSSVPPYNQLRADVIRAHRGFLASHKASAEPFVDQNLVIHISQYSHQLIVAFRQFANSIFY